jgi:uncharacterized protein YutE (UPF0331/DUF86 family)
MGAYSSFERCVQRYINLPENLTLEEKELYVLAIIKSFELTQEMLWKFLKLALDGEESLSSRKTFRAFHQSKFISDEELTTLLDSIDERNSTVHNYDDAKEIVHTCNTIVNKYYPVLKAVISRTQSLLKN